MEQTGPTFVYFHEDDYCQQEILPLACLDYCQAELDALAGEPESPRGEAPAALVSLGIGIEALCGLMKDHLPFVPEVFPGQHDFVEALERTCAFGFHEDAVLHATWDEQDRVSRMWACLYSDAPTELAPCMSALQALGARWPLLYVDWEWDFALPLDGSPKLVAALREKFQAIREKA